MGGEGIIEIGRYKGGGISAWEKYTVAEGKV